MEEVIARLRKPNGGYFITVTLKPLLYIKPASYQFACTINELLKILNNNCYDFGYVTELTDNSNVHYHAWVEFKNINNKHKFINAFKKSKVLGFCKVNTEPIVEIERTYNYMIDVENKKVGKNLKAAYDLIGKPEIAGGRIPFVYDTICEETSFSKTIQFVPPAEDVLEWPELDSNKNN